MVVVYKAGGSTYQYPETTPLLNRQHPTNRIGFQHGPITELEGPAMAPLNLLYSFFDNHSLILR